MDSINYRMGLLQELCDPEFAVEYFMGVAQTGDPPVLRLAVQDLLAAGDGVYPS